MPSALRGPHTVDAINPMGRAVLTPFDPSWLEDHPMVLDHVLSEHALHVKGLDDENEGLTWHTEKFSATQHNAALSPECHFQMKVGYFLIPEEHIITNSSLIPPGTRIQNQLREIIDGVPYVKFCVHPDAYEHYAVLLEDASVITDPEKAKHLHTSDFQSKSMLFVTSDASSIIGTPSSSYRSWIVRDPSVKDSTPFIVKVGVPCQVLGSDRWLSEAEIERSVSCQKAFDNMTPPKAWSREGSMFKVFSESMGMALAHPIYRSAYSDGAGKYSGVLIREFPAEVLDGSMRVASAASLMSVETARRGELPWICALIEGAIARGECTSAKDFLEKHFVQGYLDAIEPIVMGEGLTFEPHSQNLCVLLTPGDSPRILGFAYRDHGGIWVDLASRVQRDQRVDFFACSMMRDCTSAVSRAPSTAKALVKAQGAIDRAYVQSYAWFYRYQVLVKLFNAILEDSPTGRWSFPGKPEQIGVAEPLDERILGGYVRHKFKQLALTDGPVDEPPLESPSPTLSRVTNSSVAVEDTSETSAPPVANIRSTALKTAHSAFTVFAHAPTIEDATTLLTTLDHEYVRRLDRYFVADTLAERLPLPAVEGGVGKEKGPEVEARVALHHKFFGHWRVSTDEDTRLPFLASELPPTLKIEEAITYDAKPLNTAAIVHYIEKSQGFLLFNAENQLMAVVPKLP